MRRITKRLSQLPDRAINAILLVAAVLAMGSITLGVTSVISSRSQLPPYEYVFQEGDGAVTVSPGLIRLRSQTTCEKTGTIDLPTYTSRINRSPIRVSFTSTWWDIEKFRGATLATADDLFYTNYPFEGEVVVPGREVPMPEDIEPGNYYRAVSASTPVTFPEMYLLPISVLPSTDARCQK